jgi:hypothetical protein
MSSDAEYEAILREMAIARCELVEDAREVVSNAKELTDWRHYVREYPWLFAGTAFAVGYAIVPTLRRSLTTSTANGGGTSPPAAKASSWTSAAIALASSAALRLAVGYAGQQLEKWLENQHRPHSSSNAAVRSTNNPRDSKQNVNQHATTY